MERRTFLGAGAAALGLCTMAGASSAANGPSGTVRILVGFPAGQATDIVTRLVAERLADAFKQPVIVENHPGQGGSIAIGMVAKSPPDGSVMTMSALAAYSVNPHLYKSVGYDTLRDLAPIASVADLPLALVVNPQLPVHSVAEVVAYAKAHPNELSHCSSGNGTLSHLLMEDFKHRAGISILHVPYAGSPRAMTDLVAGRVQVGLDTLTVTMPMVKAGKLRLLAVGTSQRLPSLPEVPTIAELGYPGFEAVAWIGLTAPAGTPLPWRERVNAEVRKMLAAPDFLEKMQKLGAYPRPGSLADFDALLHSEQTRWAAIVKQSGITVD